MTLCLIRSSRDEQGSREVRIYTVIDTQAATLGDPNIQDISISSVLLINSHNTKKELVNFIVQKIEINQVLRFTPSLYQFLLKINF